MARRHALMARHPAERGEFVAVETRANRAAAHRTGLAIAHRRTPDWTNICGLLLCEPGADGSREEYVAGAASGSPPRLPACKENCVTTATPIGRTKRPLVCGEREEKG